ncbi:DeoR/GlpR family DNA-binding transcription regulator [Corynebacterium sp.]|uniref:DeoR/GlpR family DNA-binding transcription regulator n=1 Tax=Corynebacterium sp. TaxID=1720 RepID=UPI002622FAC4|nr:DeoR/GlpR family DNA-binding transcription regulator [Corynebacterium sp.]
MLSAQRRRQITSLAAVQGKVTVTELAAQFGVTAETIRRDLSQLTAEGKLYRVHGGAVPARQFQTDYVPLETRKHSAALAKQAIGRAAVQFVPLDGGTIFLDSGTTTAMIAEAIVEHAESIDKNYSLSVVTNSPHNALLLSTDPRIKVQLLGGKIRAQSQAVVGAVALQTLALLHADVAFIGTDAFTLTHGLSTHDAAEAAIKRAMIAYSDKVVTLCDSTKFGLDYIVSFAEPEKIDVVITDSSAPEGFIAQLNDTGIQTVVVDQQG